MQDANTLISIQKDVLVENIQGGVKDSTRIFIGQIPHVMERVDVWILEIMSKVLTK